MATVKLPESTDVRQIQVRQDPGVNIPAAGPSGLRELGAAISQVGSQFQAANDARVLSDLETNSAIALNDFQQEIQSDPDSFEEWEQRFDEFAKNHREEIKKSGVNRNVRDAWERSFSPLQARAKMNVMAKARETMVNKGVTDLKTKLESLQGMAITANKADRDLYTSQADLMVEDHQNTGFINDSTAKELRDKFRDGMNRARFENAVNLDPKLAKEALDAGDFEVDEKARPEWDKYVNSAIKTRENQERIDAERKKKEEKEAEKLAKEQLELSFIDRIGTDDPPTLQEIKTSELDANHQIQWMKVVEEEPKLNRELYADLTSAINGDGMYKGELVSRDTITDEFREGNLTKDAHNYLIGRWDKRHKPETEKDAAKENDVKLAVGVLANLKKNGKFNEDPTENSIAHARAVDALVKWSTANPDGDPISYVENILAPKVEKGYWDRFSDFVSSAISRGESPDTGREEAIKYLNSKNAPATEGNINKTMGFLKTRGD